MKLYKDSSTSSLKLIGFSSRILQNLLELPFNSFYGSPESLLRLTGVLLGILSNILGTFLQNLTSFSSSSSPDSPESFLAFSSILPDIFRNLSSDIPDTHYFLTKG